MILYRIYDTVACCHQVAEEIMPDGSVKREFELQLGLDELSYSLFTSDQEASDYNGTITIKYWDDKATGQPYRFLYSNGMEILVTKYLPQPVDLSNWRAPACMDQSQNVTRMSMAPYLPNMALRRGDLDDSDQDCDSKDCLPPLMAALFEGEQDGDINPGNSSGRRLMQSSSCSPRGSCRGDSRTKFQSFDLSVVKVKVEYFVKGCGVKMVDFAVPCYAPLHCYGTCSGENPHLCQSRKSFNCGLGVRVTLGDIIPSGLAWQPLRQALNSVGTLNNGAGLKLGYSSQNNKVSTIPSAIHS